MQIKAVYRKGVLRPFKKLDLREAVELDVKKSLTGQMRGIVKCWEGLEEAHEEFAIFIDANIFRPPTVWRELCKPFGRC